MRTYVQKLLLDTEGYLHSHTLVISVLGQILAGSMLTGKKHRGIVSR